MQYAHASRTADVKEQARDPSRPRAVAHNNEEEHAGFETERRGLCAACKHAHTCKFPRPTDRPLMFCDEFEGEEPKPIAVKDAAALQTRQPDPLQASCSQPASRYGGLCSSCEWRETCTFPRPEGGVWNCDEFE